MALNDVPLTGQTLNQTRAPIRSNFSTINTAFEFDHVTYGDPNQGKHKKIDFIDLASSQPATSGNELLLYNNGGQLFLQDNSNDNIPVMGASINPTNGFYNLWSGHRIRFGQLTATGTAGGLTTVAWPTPWSGTPSAVQLTIDASMTTDVDVYWNASTTNATVLGLRLIGATSITFWYWALGPI